MGALISRFGHKGIRVVTLLWLSLIGACISRAEVLTVATYNVQNYGPADRMTADGFRSDYPKPEAEKVALRRVIRALNADVLVLQEMGPQNYLDELRKDLRTEGCDYPFALLANASDEARHVAVLSRRPLAKPLTMAGLTFAYFGAAERVKRGLLEVTISTSAGDLTLFAFHLKSRLTERSDDPLCTTRRTGEATAIRDVVLRQFPDPTKSRYILLGDCNDAKNSKALERLQHRGDTKIGVLLPAFDSRHESWTYCYRREDSYMRVDHILVSPSLQSAVADGAARIYDGPETAAASDHRPVVIRLTL